MAYSLRQLAKETGFTTEAIRHLVKKRIVPRTTPRGPHTVYEEEHRLRLLAIKRLKAEGLAMRGIVAKLCEASDEELAVFAGVAEPPKPAAPDANQVDATHLPSAAPVAPRRPEPRVLVDAIVCAAAEAMEVAPGAIRAPLLAAVERAIELEIGLDELRAELAKSATLARARQ